MLFYFVTVDADKDFAVSRVSLEQLTELSWDVQAMGLYAQRDYKGAKERALVALQEKIDCDVFQCADDVVAYLIAVGIPTEIAELEPLAATERWVAANKL